MRGRIGIMAGFLMIALIALFVIGGKQYGSIDVGVPCAVAATLPTTSPTGTPVPDGFLFSISSKGLGADQKTNVVGAFGVNEKDGIKDFEVEIQKVEVTFMPDDSADGNHVNGQSGEIVFQQSTTLSCLKSSSIPFNTNLAPGYYAAVAYAKLCTGKSYSSIQTGNDWFFGVTSDGKVITYTLPALRNKLGLDTTSFGTKEARAE